jgi:hypothetical protein
VPLIGAKCAGIAGRLSAVLAELVKMPFKTSLSRNLTPSFLM